MYINEWFPNPIGNDASGEFVEFYNSATSTVRLDGYAMSYGGKKKFSLAQYAIPGRGYLVIKRNEIRFSLKNSDGALFLYGPKGGAMDSASFEGAAPEGKSFSRVDYGTTPAAHFAFMDPTPGAPNYAIDTEVHAISYPLGIPLEPSYSAGGLAVAFVGVPCIITVTIIYALIKEKNLSHLFLGRDGGDRS